MFRLRTLFKIALLLTLVPACRGETPPTAVTGNEAAAGGSDVSGTAEKVFEDFDSSNFVDSTNIDNPWFPLQPGTQFVYEGFTSEDGENIPHRVVFTVTDLTKVINGVRTVVAWDQDYSDGELVESELAFFAQDVDGNVWHLGQYPEEYEDEELVAAPAWIAGLRGAKAGISMKARPQLGGPSYSQGWSPEVNWTDRAQVFQVGESTCVPFDCFDNVLVMDEFSQEEPGAFQLKYYAPGVGNVRVGWRGDDPQQEELELVDVIRLGPEALAAVQAEVLMLELNAYEVSKGVYGHTAPAERTHGIEIAPDPAAASATSGQTTTTNVEAQLRFEEFNRDDFDENSIIIDNQWWPLTPGKQLIYEGTTFEDGDHIPHRIVFTVTDLTKVINGVNTVVIFDRDYSQNQLVESELAFYAQDKKGNVWHFGQYREVYDRVEFVGGRAWLSGHLDGARPGIMVQAEPKLATDSYSQGYAPPPFNWTDRAQVFQMGVETCVPYDCFENVLVTEEFNLEEPNAFQLKYYAPGVGNVRVGWRGSDLQQETLVLVDLLQLEGEVLEQTRAEALQLETRSYVYADTPAAQLVSGAGGQ